MSEPYLWDMSVCDLKFYLVQARVVGILGGIDEGILERGRYTHRFFTVRCVSEQRFLVRLKPGHCYYIFHREKEGLILDFSPMELVCIHSTLLKLDTFR